MNLTAAELIIIPLAVIGFFALILFIYLQYESSRDNKAARKQREEWAAKEQKLLTKGAEGLTEIEMYQLEGKGRRFYHLDGGPVFPTQEEINAQELQEVKHLLKNVEQQLNEIKANTDRRPITVDNLIDAVDNITRQYS
ncbi:hypothetical protein [Rufibacter ruber]|uniref:hypothetical protein n=1 Tax=Rufibacter ruber TaxID=1783499 RepID=UPI000834F377|nr:hypothetical protein [Rufibacter ruber]